MKYEAQTKVPPPPGDVRGGGLPLSDPEPMSLSVSLPLSRMSLLLSSLSFLCSPIFPDAFLPLTWHVLPGGGWTTCLVPRVEEAAFPARLWFRTTDRAAVLEELAQAHLVRWGCGHNIPTAVSNRAVRNPHFMHSPCKAGGTGGTLTDPRYQLTTTLTLHLGTLGPPVHQSQRGGGSVPEPPWMAPTTQKQPTAWPECGTQSLRWGAGERQVDRPGTPVAHWVPTLERDLPIIILIYLLFSSMIINDGDICTELSG